MHLANEHQDQDLPLSFRKRGSPKYFSNLSDTYLKADEFLSQAKLNIQLSPNIDRSEHSSQHLFKVESQSLMARKASIQNA
jgi:hypothetical protein